MADYSGSWWKGFAGAFSQAPSMISNALEWKERKKEQKKIDDAIAELKSNSMELTRKYDTARADGTITQEEFSDALSWAVPLGNEILSRVEKLYGNYRNLTSEKIDAELEDINAFYNLSKDLDFQNIEQMRAFGSRLTQPKAIMQWDIIIKGIEGRGKTTQPEIFPTAGGVREKYPSAGVKYTEQGYVPTFAEPSTKEPSAADKKYNWAIEHHSLPEGSPGKISDEQLFKFMGVDVSDPEKRNTIQQRLDEMDKLGATTEEKKKYLLGGGGTDKVTDPEGILFGINGIMKDYINSGSQLGEQQKIEIRNNYDIIKPSLSVESRTQVEDYLQQIGIDVNAPIEAPTTEPTPEPSGGGFHPVTAIKGWLGQKGVQGVSPTGNVAASGGNQPSNEIPPVKVPTEAKEAMIPMMSNSELYNALKGLDPSDPIYQSLYDEAVKRGLIKK